MTHSVLQVAPALERDGIGRDAADLARRARAAGWRSFVLSPGGPLERELAAAGCTHLTAVADAAGPLGSWRLGRQIAAVVRSQGIGLVHAHGPLAAAAQRGGATLLATVHDATRPPPQAARLVAVSDHVAEVLVERHAVAPERLRVVRRWIDPDEFDPERVRGHRVQALAERWRIEHGPRLVLVAPLHAEDHGHLQLVRALARLGHVDFTVVLLGTIATVSGYGDALVAALRRSGLADRVRFGGEAEDLPAALALADIVVVPATLPDGSARIAVAAQAMGRPVIVTNTGALPEAVMPAATGWLVPKGDTDELAHALDLALGMDEAVRARLAARARAFVSEEFGLARQTGRLLDLYRELVAAKLAPSG